MLADAFAFEHIVTKGGLNLWIRSVPSHIIAAGVLVRVGSGNDPVGQGGLSHLVEHLVVETQSPLGGATQRDFFADTHGLLIGSYGETGHAGTQWNVVGGPQSLRQIFRVLSSFARNTPDASLLEFQKEVMEREFIVENPKGSQEEMNFIYGFFVPEGHALLNRESLESVRLLRAEDVAAHFATWYRLPNVHMFLVGPVDRDEACALVDEYFHSMRHEKEIIGQEGIMLPMTGLRPDLEAQRIEVHICEQFGLPRPNWEQDPVVILRAGLPRAIYDQKDRVWDVLGRMLHDILFAELRQKYGTMHSAEIDAIVFSDIALFLVQLACPQEQLHIVENVLAQIPRIVEGSKNRYVLSRNASRRNVVYADLSLSKLLAATMVDVELYGKVRTQGELIDAVEKVTFSEVVELAHELFGPKGCMKFIRLL